MSTPKLMHTKKYEIFKHDVTNRDIENTRRIQKSMQRWGFLPAFPLFCVRNGGTFLIVKDGGHRLEAAKAEGIEVYYVVLDSCDVSIPEINNTQRTWKLRHYMQSYVSQGNPEYIALYEFYEQHDLSLQICARLLFGEQAQSGNADRSVKDGTFRVKNAAYAEMVAEIIESIGKHSNLAKNSWFINAISRICLVKKFDPSRFCRNAERCSYKLLPKATLDEYLDLCEDIYNNHYSKDMMPLKFLANKASRERNAIVNKNAPQ